MDLTDLMGGLMRQMGGQQPDGQMDPDQGFDQLAGMIPRGAMGSGVAEAFRSSDTPPFAQMLGGLFGQSNGSQQASVVNMLLAAAGPMLLQKLMGGGAGASNNPLAAVAGALGGGGSSNPFGGGAGGGGALGMLSGLLGGGAGASEMPQLTEEQASQLSPEAIQELASHVEKEDPSIMDKMGDFYAEHPTLVKSLGAGALAIILGKVAQSQQNS